jgi:16S rRNA (adenine1518-N6/adenine1519-N6)-dimethyltransferase
MTHRLGQVFLVDGNIIGKIIQFAHLTPQTPVIEIGCGNGALTVPLCQAVNQLDVIEIDAQWIHACQPKVHPLNPNVRFHHADILNIPLTPLCTPTTHILGNLPYYISTKILKKLIAHSQGGFQAATIMVQKEFAKKCIAKPGEKSYTSLSIYIQNFFEFKYGFTVTKQCFRPIPKVDSAVIQLTPKPSPAIADVNHPYFRVVNAAFWGRRKPLLSALKKSPYISWKTDIRQVPFFQAYPTVRGETLSAEMFLTVYDQIKSHMAELPRDTRASDRD